MIESLLFYALLGAILGIPANMLINGLRKPPKGPEDGNNHRDTE